MIVLYKIYTFTVIGKSTKTSNSFCHKSEWRRKWSGGDNNLI